MTYEHPRWPARHKPNITSGEIGAKVDCCCGWWSTAKNAPLAAKAFLEHLAETKAAS